MLAFEGIGAGEKGGKKRAYRIRNDEGIGFGGVLGDGFCEVAHDGGIGVEQIYRIDCQLHSYSSSSDLRISPSRVIPGFLGTPAGIKTISAPVNASFRPFFSGEYPLTMLLVLICPTSAATPIGGSVYWIRQ